MNSSFRNLAIWVVIALLLVALFNLFQGGARTGARGEEISYSEFLAGVEQGSVSEVTIQKHKITGNYRDKGSRFTTNAPDDASLIPALKAKGVKITAKPPEDDVPSILGLLANWFPMLLLIGVWIFFMRQMQSGGGRAMGFGKSKAKLLTERQGRVTFEDVAGVDEAKADLQEIVEFLRDPQKFQKLGGRIPRGCLLVGPPGTGKTLIARAVAGEANVPFFTISGSDFVEMFVGVGASRVRDMFEQAKKNAPCIIFIDEIDAVGRHRGAGLGGGNDEREQTLNQLLVEMDGFEANEGIIIIAATNRPDVLDPALLRPGRFDRQIVVPNPDVGGREKILKVHMRKVPLAPDVDPKVIARGTPGFSGADLANLVNEAALLAARRNKRLVTQQEFEDSKDKVMMGAERRSMIMTEEEKLATAYHEAGHALVTLMVEGNDPLHKVTIIPRGRALGVTMALPERDKLSLLQAVVRGAFGHHVRWPRGRAADLRRGPPQHRRLQRHPAGDRARAQHGDRMGHERQAGAAALQRQPAGGVPRPRHHAAPEHVRGDHAPDRRGGAPAGDEWREEGARGARRQPRQAGGHHAGADGVRDRLRRGGEGGDARREDRAQHRRRGHQRPRRPRSACCRQVAAAAAGAGAWRVGAVPADVRLRRAAGWRRRCARGQPVAGCANPRATSNASPMAMAPAPRCRGARDRHAVPAFTHKRCGIRR